MTLPRAEALAAAGEVAVTIDALGPWATTYVAALLVGGQDATVADAPARVMLSERQVAG